ncbi:MAG: [FeFe] hydrogenase H-cluster maturation GTPase HydF [Oscillospiraceae bacterium]|nr:[FeFe] hydrogenase H-cluster maturation GTPase HydF [Oscillospiraceae bacterium]
MCFNAIPAARRAHIGFFGRRNAGKSSLVNAVTGQALSVVSPVPGTTTDPVRKAMELLPLGPVVILDTPGFDDEGQLGALRVEKTRQALRECDAAVLVADAVKGMSPIDRELLELIRGQGIPYLIAHNKSDLTQARPAREAHEIDVSALTGYQVEELKERLARLLDTLDGEPPLLADLFAPGETVVLVTPVDSAAPKGRLILPQQQALREALDAHAICVIARETELAAALAGLNTPPALVVTDSQVFARVAGIVPVSVPLTSFSILFARYQGFLEASVRGARTLAGLPEGARILIAEGCTHHRQCDDIGTVKLPRWIRAFTGKEFDFSFCAGRDFTAYGSADRSAGFDAFDLVIHCGACMLGRRAVRSRLRCCEARGVPLTNYGVLIAEMNGILERCLLDGRLLRPAPGYTPK